MVFQNGRRMSVSPVTMNALFRMNWLAADLMSAELEAQYAAVALPQLASPQKPGASPLGKISMVRIVSSGHAPMVNKIAGLDESLG
jgi:hypothetical protein